MCPLATGYRSVSRMHSFPAVSPPLLFLATSLQLLPQFVSEAKLAVPWSPSFISPLLSHRQPGRSQTNSITADNTATARKKLLCRPNGPAFHLARAQCSAQGLHGHKHKHLMRETYKLQLAMTCMHHTRQIKFWSTVNISC